ncbi:cytochrome c3 family protein [Sphingobium fuliginis]|uniref:cytochrome c3 family protein n=1 Tax=Sphingobium fuliginis (strain ATCC 27551) TaxID=336203 RepID=UPI0003F5B477|nr:cytochrome c3 family protein [Sphingobium fuliginis]
MSFLVRQISLTADGREIVRAATIAQAQLSLGRAAESDIHLPDLALEPDHARIEQVDERTIRVRATGTLGFELEGRTVLRAEIDPAKGAELRFGGHRVTLSRGDDGATILSIRRVDAVSEASEEKEETKVFSLRGLLPGKRLTAWALALAILIGFLAIPIWSYAGRPADDTRNIYKMVGDKAWSSGPLSQAHHALEGRCETCHQKAFVSVRDSACQTCHRDAHDHAPAARIAMARAEGGLGDKLLAGVAAAFGKPPEGACVDCHREHEGAGPMQPTPQAFCTDCHGTLKDRLKDTKLGNAADFGTSHPQFSALVQARPGQHPRFSRASLDSRPMDDSGLKFPHDIHLSASGGVAKMARTMKAQYGFGDALACKDCHKRPPTACASCRWTWNATARCATASPSRRSAAPSARCATASRIRWSRTCGPISVRPARPSRRPWAERRGGGPAIMRRGGSTMPISGRRRHVRPARTMPSRRSSPGAAPATTAISSRRRTRTAMRVGGCCRCISRCAI